jgi:mitogen-activated protein kinase kinase kinase
MTATALNGTFASPTESEFSVAPYEEHDSVRWVEVDLLVVHDADNHRNWGEKRVGEWLRSINCAQYVETFKGETIERACPVLC